MRLLFLVILLAQVGWAQNFPQIQESLRMNRVIFLGENHRSEVDHRGQLGILQDLEKLDDRPLVIAAEMFTTVADRELDDWLKTSQPAVPSELWKREWGHPYPLYQEIFFWVKAKSVTVVSLRPDPALTKEVKKRGPAACLELIGEVLLGPWSYYQNMEDIVAQHMPEGSQPEASMVDRFFLVQCFWDEFMAWRITQALERYPEARIAVLVGNGHLHPQHGIPWRLGRRLPGVSWLSIAFSAEQEGIVDVVLR